MARRRKPEDDLAAISANPPQQIPSGSRVDFKALMPGYRLRHDGWNQQRVQRYLDTLAHTGCAKDAARVAGMSRVAATRAQKRFPRFAAACGEALGRAQQGLIAIAYQRAVEGRETVIIRKGEEFERRIQPSDSMLGLLIKRGDMRDELLPSDLADLADVPRAQILTFAEWQSHVRFTSRGDKYQAPPPDEVDRKLKERTDFIYRRLNDMALRGEQCPCCMAPLPPDWPRQSMATLVVTGVIKAVDLFSGIEMEVD